MSLGDYSVGLNAEKFGTSQYQFRNVSEWNVSPFISAGNVSMNGDFVLQLGGAAILGFDASINLSQIGREIGGLFNGD